MNILALILFIIAAMIFLAVTVGVPKPNRFWMVPTGLFFLTVGFIVQAVWVTPHVVHLGS